MAGTTLTNLRSVREVLGKSQSELGALLGVSTRAVQSYEQGWRPVPLHVQRSAALLLFLAWRKLQKRVEPCWSIRACTPQQREDCPSYQFRAGDLCWMLRGNRCAGKRHADETDMSRCQKCPTMAQWLA